MAVRQLAGKRILITGASSGIGRDLAIGLAAAGAAVILAARRADKLVELESEIRSTGGKAFSFAADVTSDADRTRLLADCESRLGGLDVLINNAGVGAMGRFDQADPQRLRQIFEVNFFALAELTRAALPMLKSGNDALIVNISSILGHRGAPLKSEYSASKFAVHGFSDAIRAELANDAIEVLLVSPSTTDSEFFDAAIEDDTRKDWKKGGAMSTEVVAAKTIKAMRKRRHEIILTFGGRVLVWLDRMIPGLANRIIAKFGQ